MGEHEDKWPITELVGCPNRTFHRVGKVFNNLINLVVLENCGAGEDS